jgi:hypothetical protein
MHKRRVGKLSHAAQSTGWPAIIQSDVLQMAAFDFEQIWQKNAAEENFDKLNSYWRKRKNR